MVYELIVSKWNAHIGGIRVLRLDPFDILMRHVEFFNDLEKESVAAAKRETLSRRRPVIRRLFQERIEKTLGLFNRAENPDSENGD